MKIIQAFGWSDLPRSDHNVAIRLFWVAWFPNRAFFSISGSPEWMPSAESAGPVVPV